MQTVTFDRTSGIPMYRQLADHIRKQIATGVYHPGDILPSEADYIRDFNLSRTTVRLAMGLITTAHLVKREQGRGTIVLSQVHSNLPYLSSFTEEVKRQNREPGVILLSQEEEQIPNEAAGCLSLPLGSVVIKVVRLRLVDSDPIGLTISWLNTVRFPELKSIDFKVVSLYNLFESQLKFSIHSAVETIRADPAEDYEAQQLKIKRGSPVLRLLRTTYVLNNQEQPVPIEYVDGAFNGSLYSVDVELYRKASQ